MDQDGSYIVELDIASCYEYIDHDLLLEELALRTLQSDVPKSIVTYLHETQGRSLGIPQLSNESDTLADTYLDILERRIRRDGYLTSRFADDFRILAPSHEVASKLIEDCSEYARLIGLVLSTEKTTFYRVNTLAARNKSEDNILQHYFTDVTQAMAQAELLAANEYNDEDDEELELDLEEIEFEAYRAILNDWHRSRNPFNQGDVPFDSETLHSLIPRCLFVLRSDDEPVQEDLLRDVIYDHPSRIESVIKYVLSRRANHDEGHMGLIKVLMNMKRQSPWSKLWLIYAARTHQHHAPEKDAHIINWLKAQTIDKHEIVRAEAAWALAEISIIPSKQVISLYQRATELTRPLLAATLTKSQEITAGVLTAVEGDSALTKEAIAWALKATSTQ